RPPSEETSDGSSLSEEGNRGASSPGRSPNWCSAATRSARRSRAALVVTIAVLGLLVAEEALAGGPSYQVQFAYRREAGADSCPTGDEVRVAVAEILGYEPFVEDGVARRAIECVMTPRRHGFRAIIRLRSVERVVIGERALNSTSSSCRELAAATAFALALAIDPMASPNVDTATHSDRRRASSASEGDSENGQTGRQAVDSMAGSIPQEEPVEAVAGGSDSSSTQQSTAAGEPARPGPRPKRRGTQWQNDERPQWYRRLLASRPYGAAGTRFGLAEGRVVPALAFDLGLRSKTASLGVDFQLGLPLTFSFLDGEVSISTTAVALVPCYHRGWLAGCGMLARGRFVVSTTGYDSNGDGVVVRTTAVGGRLAGEAHAGGGLFMRLHADLLVTTSGTRLWLGIGEDRLLLWDMPMVVATVGWSVAKRW
ncbi:MAG: hypothetical protein V2A73_10060, partial [Pseudomonadota bacterium]